MSSEYNKTSSKRLARLYRTAVSSKRHKSGSIGSDIPGGQTSLSIIPEAEAPAPAPAPEAPAPEAPAPAPAPEAPAPEAPTPEAPAPEAPAPEATLESPFQYPQVRGMLVTVGCENSGHVFAATVCEDEEDASKEKVFYCNSWGKGCVLASEIVQEMDKQNCPKIKYVQYLLRK